MTILSELIRHDAPIAYGAVAVYARSAAIEKKYRFTSRFGEEVLLHEVDGDRVRLPRALCPVGPNDERDRGTPVAFAKAPTPRPHQVQLFGEIEEFLANGLSGIVSAPTGYGKTIIGYHAAATLGVRTLVVTTKDDIYRQWIDGARQFLGLEPHEIGEIRGDKCEVLGETKFCVAMIHSLSIEGKYPPWIGKGFGLVLFDECHRVPADQFSRTASMFKAYWRLGLSATPERADGKELLVSAHIGPLRAKAEGELLVPKVLRFTSAWECPRVLRPDPKTGQKKVMRLPHQPGKTTHVEKIIAADPVRNHLLGEMIAAAHARGRAAVVFSTLHDHLKALHRVAREHHGISGRDMGFYIGAATKAEKEDRERVKVRPVIFTTFSMMAEGTDVPWLDCCILAMPRSTVTQPVGRIRREYPDKKAPVVMDLVDLDSNAFSGYAASRMKWYRSIGAEIQEM